MVSGEFWLMEKKQIWDISAKRLLLTLGNHSKQLKVYRDHLLLKRCLKSESTLDVTVA